MTNNEYISDLTGLSIESLDKIQSNSLLVLSHQLKNQLDLNSFQDIDLDKYGKIKIELSKNNQEFELVFIPSEQLLLTIRNTLRNNKSLLIDQAERTAVQKIKEKYDSLI